MKNMNKLFCGLLLAFGVLLATREVKASVGVRAPKQMYELNYTTAISSVTAFTVLESTSGIQKAGAVYQLILSTGASGDYVILFDTSTATGLVLGPPSGGATQAPSQIGPRYYFSSTSANTTIVFDPPLQFYNGLMMYESSATNAAGVSYELGRGLNGQ